MAESEYREALVTYIDILGFREMVRDSERSPSRIPEIRQVLKVLRKQIGVWNRYNKDYFADHIATEYFRAFSFSDLTVRAMIIDSKDKLVAFFMAELVTLVDEQLRLACRKDGNTPILLRGGMTLGPLEVHRRLLREGPLVSPILSDEFLFGPALIRAYDLENTSAIFPRVVIDSRVIKAVTEESARPLAIKALESIGASYQDFVSLSEDGMYFVDYLAACKERLDFNNRGPSLMIHKRMIETQLAKLKKEGAREGVIQKYLWLANYHNSKVDELPEPEFEPPVFEGEPDEDEQRETHRRNRQELYISEELLNLLK